MKLSAYLYNRCIAVNNGSCSINKFKQTTEIDKNDFKFLHANCLATNSLLQKPNSETDFDVTAPC